MGTLKNPWNWYLRVRLISKIIYFEVEVFAHIITNFAGIDINKICRSGLTILGRSAQLGLVSFVKQVTELLLEVKLN